MSLVVTIPMATSALTLILGVVLYRQHRKVAQLTRDLDTTRQQVRIHGILLNEPVDPHVRHLRLVPSSSRPPGSSHPMPSHPAGRPRQ